MVSVTFLTVPSVCGQIKVINISKVNDGGGLECYQVIVSRAVQ